MRPPNIRATILPHTKSLSPCLLGAGYSFWSKWLASRQPGLTEATIGLLWFKYSSYTIFSAKQNQEYALHSSLQDYITFMVKSSEFWKGKLLHIERWAEMDNYHMLLWTCCFQQCFCLCESSKLTKCHIILCYVVCWQTLQWSGTNHANSDTVPSEVLFAFIVKCYCSLCRIQFHFYFCIIFQVCS